MRIKASENKIIEIKKYNKERNHQFKKKCEDLLRHQLPEYENQKLLD